MSNRIEDFFSIFIFPFRYQWNHRSKITPNEVGAALVDGNHDPQKGWVEEEFKIEADGKSPDFEDRKGNYAEFFYFHPFVRKAIFSGSRLNTLSGREAKNSQMIFLSRTDIKELELVACRLNNSRTPIKRKLRTAINSIDLHLFDNQIGLLSITTENFKIHTEHPSDNHGAPNPYVFDFEDLLAYNDLVRRVYPPFLGTLDEGKDSVLDKLKKRIVTTADAEATRFLGELEKLATDKCPVAATKFDAKALPDSLTLYLADHNVFANEDFSKGFTGQDRFPSNNLINGLLAPISPFSVRTQEAAKKEMTFRSFTDDRMLTVCYVGNQVLANSMKSKCCGAYSYESSDEWYKLMFVDGASKGVGNPDMQRTLVREHTYARWVEFGTLYGLTRYSLVALCDAGSFSKIVVRQPMKSNYYQLAMIVLFQKAMLLKFHEDVDALTAESEKLEKLNSTLRNHAGRLNRDFIRFINQYWFTEASPQEQGIEMYQQWLNIMGLKGLFEHVQRSIRDLAEYMDDKTEQRTEAFVRFVTIVGLPLTVVLNLWIIYADVLVSPRAALPKGKSWIPFPVMENLFKTQWSFWWLLVNIVVGVSITFILYKLSSWSYPYLRSELRHGWKYLKRWLRRIRDGSR